MDEEESISEWEERTGRDWDTAVAEAKADYERAEATGGTVAERFAREVEAGRAAGAYERAVAEAAAAAAAAAAPPPVPPPVPTPVPPPVPPPVPAPAPALIPAAGIVGALSSIAGYFYSIYLETHGWIWPFWYVSEFFYSLSSVFSNLARAFSDFITLVNNLISQVANVLSYVPNLVTIRDWFYSWWSNVTSVVTSWWSATQVTVQGWIAAATQGLSELRVAWDNFWRVTWPGWVSNLNSLKSSWDNFWSYTLPSLVSFSWLGTWWASRLKDIDSLVDSKLKSWFPFYNDLVKLWSSIALFFTNPVEYIWQRLADWLLGPEG